MQTQDTEVTYLGIDVGGTKIQGAYMKGDNVVLTRRVETPTSGYPDFLAGLQRIVAEVQEAGARIGQIGIGLPGTVSTRGITWMPNLPFLNGRDLAGDLARPVVLANDAQLALLGEGWRGAAQHCRSAALVSVGTGVGGAFMVDRKIVRGAHGGAGAFGWLNLDWHEKADPEHGYVERHAAGTTLDTLARQLDPPTTSHALIAHARARDAASGEVIRQFCTVLGAAFASIASILDPDLLILAGGLADAFDLFAATLRESMCQLAAPGVRATPIVPAGLGKHAAAYGALRAAMPPQISWL